MDFWWPWEPDLKKKWMWNGCATLHVTAASADLDNKTRGFLAVCLSDNAMNFLLRWENVPSFQKQITADIQSARANNRRHRYTCAFLRSVDSSRCETRNSESPPCNEKITLKKVDADLLFVYIYCALNRNKLWKEIQEGAIGHWPEDLSFICLKIKL